MAKALSTSKKAISLIRAEIRHFYGPAMTGSQKRAIIAMRQDADAYNCGSYRAGLSDWQKGAGLVDAGCFRCYHDDIKNFLRGIYGDRVDRWTGERAHRVYASLIGREYSAMLRRIK